MNIYFDFSIFTIFYTERHLLLSKGLASGYRPILPKIARKRSAAEPLIPEPISAAANPHLDIVDIVDQPSIPPMFDLAQIHPPRPDASLVPGFDFPELPETQSSMQTFLLSDFETPAADQVTDVVQASQRSSSPRSIYWWERTVKRLKSQNEALNQRLLTQETLLFQRNAEYIQMCEENRTLQTDVKVLRSARDLLLQEVSLFLLPHLFARD